MEFVLVEKYIMGTFTQADMYWCDALVNPDLFLECLDIAGPSTLYGAFNSSSWNISSGVDIVDAGKLVTNPTTLATAISGKTSAEIASSRFGTGEDDNNCGKKCGDYSITAHDMTVLMLYQFGVPPYDDIQMTPQLVYTVQGCTNVSGLCSTQSGLSVARNDLPLFAINNPNGQCFSVSEFIVWSLDNAGSGRRLLESPVALEYGTDETMRIALDASGRSHARALSTPQRFAHSELNAKVILWSTWPEGRWYRINIPIPVLSLDVSLFGTDDAYFVPLTNELTPELDEQPSELVEFDGSRYHVRFKRHLEDRGDTMHCAPIVSLLNPEVVLHASHMSIGQIPISDSHLCAFDVFIYKPRKEERRKLSEEDCSITVLAGSSAMDLVGGSVQETDSFCLFNFHYEPPSPPPPPPLSPLLQGETLVRTVTYSIVARASSFDVDTFKQNLAQKLDTDVSRIDVEIVSQQDVRRRLDVRYELLVRIRTATAATSSLIARISSLTQAEYLSELGVELVEVKTTPSITSSEVVDAPSAPPSPLPPPHAPPPPTEESTARRMRWVYVVIPVGLLLSAIAVCLRTVDWPVLEFERTENLERPRVRIDVREK